jgi:hypothetical protein
MAKRKHRRKLKYKKVKRSIPETANPVRFLIFLIIGLILFAIFFYFVVIESGTLSPQ